VLLSSLYVQMIWIPWHCFQNIAMCNRKQFTLQNYLSLYGSKAVCWTLATFSVSSSFYKVGTIPWTGDQPIARRLSTHRTTQTQNKRTRTSMPWVGFEPTIPVFEREKTVHALDCAATVIGILQNYIVQYTGSKSFCRTTRFKILAVSHSTELHS
jgi:hypothetical protein